MPGKNEKQLKTKSKKRTRAVASETDSNDECDSPTMKTCRKRRNSKRKNNIGYIANGPNGELGAAGSSQSDSHINATSVECDKKSEPPLNNKIASNDSINEVSPTKVALNTSDLVVSSDKATIDPVVASDSTPDTNAKTNEDEQHEICPICWGTFENQEVGEPMLCQHSFCLQCLIEWSKNKNTCPLDGRTFSHIVVRNKLGGTRTRCVPVEPTNIMEDDWSGNIGYESMPDGNSDNMGSHDYYTEDEEASNVNLSCTDSGTYGDLERPSESDYDDEERLSCLNSNDEEHMFYSNSDYEGEDYQESPSNHDDEERGSSSNHDEEERGSSSNHDEEERDSFSNRDDEEINSCSNDDDEEGQSSPFDNDDEDGESSAPPYDEERQSSSPSYDEERQSFSPPYDEESLSSPFESDCPYSWVWDSDQSPCSYNDDPGVAASSNSSSTSSLSESSDHSSAVSSCTNSSQLAEYSSPDHSCSYSASSGDDSSYSSTF